MTIVTITTSIIMTFVIMVATIMTTVAVIIMIVDGGGDSSDNDGHRGSGDGSNDGEVDHVGEDDDNYGDGDELTIMKIF